MSRGVVDLTGRRYGKIVICEKKYENDSYSDRRCVCDCGNEFYASYISLIGGSTKRCPECRKRKTPEEINIQRHLTSALNAMKQRCYNPKNPAYRWYGRRKISICQEWRDNSKAFYEWALANGYQIGLSIDRIDNNGNYCPEYCQWITRSENSSKAQAKRKKQ